MNSSKFWRSQLAPCTLIFYILISVIALAAQSAEKKRESEPKIIDPGPPPSDAIVLYDGKDLSQWQNEKGGDAKWKLEEGAMVVNGTGSLVTKEEFADVQLHVE